MSAASRAQAGTGVLFKMGDGGVTVTVAAPGAATGALALPVAALSGPIPNSTVLTFVSGRTATLSAAAAAGATSLTVTALAAAIATGDVANNVNEAFATVAEMTDITPPNQQTDTFETTHHLSPGRVKEFGTGMIDPGDMSITLNWLPTDPTQNGTTGLEAARQDGKIRNFQVIYPFTPIVTDTFKGLVTGIQPATPIGDRMTAQVSIKVSGKVTRT